MWGLLRSAARLWLNGLLYQFLRSKFRSPSHSFGVYCGPSLGVVAASLLKQLFASVSHPLLRRACGCRAGRRRYTDPRNARRYSSCSGTKGASNMVSRRMNGVTSGSWESTTSPLPSVASHSRLWPSGANRSRYELCSLLILMTRITFFASSGHLAKSPSSVFTLSDLGSRFTDPM